MTASVVVNTSPDPTVVPTQTSRPASLVRDFSCGVADVRAGWRQRTIWRVLGANDVTSRYRRTIIGPFWLTIQMALWVVGIGFVYGALFKAPLKEFVPFVAVGILLWTLLSGLIVEGGASFIGATGYIKSAYLPLSTYAYQTVLRQFIFFLHSVVIIAILLIVLGVRPSIAALWTTPAIMLLVVIDGFFVCLLMGSVTARFRDIQPATIGLMNLLIFLTPVFWSTQQLNRPVWAVAWNPLAWFVEAFRQPLLGGAVNWTWWVLLLGFSVALGVFTMITFGRSQRRIAYWV